MPQLTTPTLKPTAEPRDQTRDRPYYLAAIEALAGAARAYLTHDNPVLHVSVAPKAVRIGLALYSAGAEPASSLEHFRQGAAFQTSFITEGRKYAFVGRGGIDNYLELYSAAYLADDSQRLVEALRKCTYTEADPENLGPLIEQFCAVLSGQPAPANKAHPPRLKPADERVSSLPALFETTSAADATAFGRLLEVYLARHWGPAIEVVARRELKAKEPQYVGKWSLLGAALCKRFGSLPELSPQAAKYLPVHLLGIQQAR